MQLIRLVLLLLILTSCSKNAGVNLTPDQLMAQKLELNTWKIVSVSVDGVDQTALFTGLTLKFTAANYSTTGTSPVWPNSGTWQFVANADATEFIRDDGIVVTIATISSTSLVMSLTWTKTNFSGRSNSIAGKHEFTFSN